MVLHEHSSSTKCSAPLAGPGSQCWACRSRGAQSQVCPGSARCAPRLKPGEAGWHRLAPPRAAQQAHGSAASGLDSGRHCRQAGISREPGQQQLARWVGMKRQCWHPALHRTSIAATGTVLPPPVAGPRALPPNPHHPPHLEPPQHEALEQHQQHQCPGKARHAAPAPRGHEWRRGRGRREQRPHLTRSHPHSRLASLAALPLVQPGGAACSCLARCRPMPPCAHAG